MYVPCMTPCNITVLTCTPGLSQHLPSKRKSSRIQFQNVPHREHYRTPPPSVVCFPDLSPIQGTLTRCYWLFVSQCRPSSAFAAFAGTSSSLASASIATNGLQRPIWCGESAERTDGTSIPVRPGVNPTGNVADNAEGLSEPTKSSGSNEPSLNSVENPLAALAASATANPQQSMFWIHPTSGRRF